MLAPKPMLLTAMLCWLVMVPSSFIYAALLPRILKPGVCRVKWGLGSNTTRVETIYWDGYKTFLVLYLKWHLSAFKQTTVINHFHFFSTVDSNIRHSVHLTDFFFHFCTLLAMKASWRRFRTMSNISQINKPASKMAPNNPSTDIHVLV